MYKGCPLYILACACIPLTWRGTPWIPRVDGVRVCVLVCACLCMCGITVDVRQVVIPVLESTPAHFVHWLVDQSTHFLHQPLHIVLSAPSRALAPGGCLAFLRNYPLTYPGIVSLVAVEGPGGWVLFSHAVCIERVERGGEGWRGVERGYDPGVS